jgi:NADH-quinone oxidoreductase subunit C
MEHERSDESQIDAIVPQVSVVADAVESAAVTTFTPPGGQTSVIIDVSRDDYYFLIEAARNAGYETFIDLCAVDHLAREPRFDVVVNLVSTRFGERLRIKVGIPNDEPSLATISTLYAGADFYERESWDLFGIVFEGHPSLTRLLMPDEWEGHPLRKDYPVGSVPVEFKATE